MYLKTGGGKQNFCLTL